MKKHKRFGNNRYYNDNGILYRICTGCNEHLIENKNNFNIKDSKTGRFTARCKECLSKSNKEWETINKEKRRAQKKIYRLKNKEKIRQQNKEYSIKNKEKIKLYQQKYNIEHYDKVRVSKRKYEKFKRDNDLSFRLRQQFRRSISEALNNRNIIKEISILKVLPYSIVKLMQHIESQFEPWMNWNNRGLYSVKTWKDDDPSTWTWQLDHIKPQSDFKYTSMEDVEFQKCWALENLRPYSANAKQNYLDGLFKTRHISDKELKVLFIDLNNQKIVDGKLLLEDVELFDLLNNECIYLYDGDTLYVAQIIVKEHIWLAEMLWVV